MTEVYTKHAVIIKFNYGMEDLDHLHQLELQLGRIIMEANVGEYDGHEINMDGSDGFLYMYGPNAEYLFKSIATTLKNCFFMKDAIAILRFGPAEEGVNFIEVPV